MAGVNFIGSFIYSWVESTWQVTTVVMKYFVLANIGYLLSNKDFSLEKLEENIMRTGKPVILGIAVAGMLTHLANIPVTPFLKLFSQAIAVLTLGFIFWRY